VLHSIDEILTVVMCGIRAGEKTIHGIYLFSKIKEKWLKSKIGLKLLNRIPSHRAVRFSSWHKTIHFASEYLTCCFEKRSREL